MPAQSSTEWHAVVDNYVLTVAELYLSMAKGEES